LQLRSLLARHPRELLGIKHQLGQLETFTHQVGLPDTHLTFNCDDPAFSMHCEFDHNVSQRAYLRGAANYRNSLFLNLGRFFD
jgi:hypothetical protein